MLRTLFFGTPEFAVPTLAALVEGGYPPVLVVSQPARPAGRGQRLQDPPVATWARDHGLEVRQVAKVHDEDVYCALSDLEPDVAVVVAFGQIFRRRLLEIPRLGCVNLHASLLPKYRGAAPIQAAIAAGESVTGVSTMRVEVGLDTGAVFEQAEVAIGADETAGELAPRLAAVGAELMVHTLRGLERGALVPRPQDDALATHAPRLTKDDARADWRLAAHRLYDRLRAFTPWPGMTSELAGEPLKILRARPLAAREDALAAEPGTLLGLDRDAAGGVLAVACGPAEDGSATILGLERVQRPGRKPISAADFAHGERLPAGARFALP